MLTRQFAEPEAARINANWGNIHVQKGLHVLALDISGKPPSVAARLNGSNSENGMDLKEFRETFSRCVHHNGEKVEIECVKLHQHPSIGVIECKLPDRFPCGFARPFITLCRAALETYRLGKTVVENPTQPVKVGDIFEMKNYSKKMFSQNLIVRGVTTRSDHCWESRKILLVYFER